MRPDGMVAALQEGIDRARDAGADVVLVDPQFSRFLRANADLDPYEAALQQVSAMPGVVLFRRFDVMRSWAEDGEIDLERAGRGRSRAHDGAAEHLPGRDAGPLRAERRRRAGALRGTGLPPLSLRGAKRRSNLPPGRGAAHRAGGIASPGQAAGTASLPATHRAWGGGRELRWHRTPTIRPLKTDHCIMTLAALLRHLTFAAGLALLSAATVRLMIAARLMDRPDGRKAHDRPTPKGGGIGIVVAFLVGIVVLYQFAEFARLADPYFLGVIEASVAIAVVAFLDDVYDWNFSVKLGAQVLAGAGRGGQRAVRARLSRALCRRPLPVGWLAPPVTLFWLLFATNAMNFIDGLNGLAGGVALIAAGFLAGIAATHDGWFAYAASLLLAAGIAGFLPFNFPRARIFMGDVGSQFCGFMLAVLAVVASRFQGLETVVPAGADAAVRRAVRCRLHPAAPGRGGRAADRAASRPPVPGRAALRRAGPGGGAGPLGVRDLWRAVLPAVHCRADRRGSRWCRR